MNPTFPLYLALLAMGAGWGLSIPLVKIAVSTGYQPFGLIFWQLVIVVAILALITRLRGKKFGFHIKHIRIYLMVALFGAVVPDIFFYISAARLPAGVMAIIISSVPLFSLPIALLMGNERFSWFRLVGLAFGMSGILLLIAPEASLPDKAMAAFVPIALLAPLFYATEGNLVARWGTGDLDSVQTILGASFLGALITLPIALMTGQWINPSVTFGAAETALVASAIIHALVYAGYVWMVGRAGSVFAAQTSYLVTACGVLWSMLLLSERYSPYIWAAFAVMLAGVILVQPRARKALAPIQ